ncbi:MAG TPA: hypothetical protein VHU44_13230 [Acidobacteriaceae bacterium]|jgi:hypothetical protein|nr:hypothetical protein [Acidobacteriaceae bacterium]
MTWHDDPTHPFAGIAEKLKRADQNIVNLDTEIKSFLQGGEYPVIPKPNTQGWEEALAYHRHKPIPLRFSVLTGEIVHHLRSSLDHVVWHFSDSAARAKPHSIEFPIFEIEPTEKNEIARYAGKVKGITNANVLRLIKEMQPYQVGSDVANHLLLIIHNMDRWDKHRELVIVDSGVSLAIPPHMVELQKMASLYAQGELPAFQQIELAYAIHDYMVTPGISFREFGKHRPYAIIRGLSQLWNAASNAVGQFASEV